MPEDNEESGRMPYIQEIQLEASNFYALLSNTLLQEILNAFTQTINSLNKKFERIAKIEIQSTKSFRNIPSVQRAPLTAFKPNQRKNEDEE